MKRRSKLIFSLVSLCFSIAVLCFGVYSALSVSYSISGNVSYEINDVFVELDLSVYRALSTTPANSATHNQNVSTIKDAGDNISETDFGKLSYTDHESTYENEVVKPGNEDGIFEADSPNLTLTYGSPTNDNQGYAFYIVIDIHNLGSEIINAQITAPTSLENTILRDSGNVEITADGTERIVLGLALDDVTTGITSADFTYTITISRGELPIEPITDMQFTLDEDNKTATLTSYAGSGGDVVIPESIGYDTVSSKTLTFGKMEDTESEMNAIYFYQDLNITLPNQEAQFIENPKLWLNENRATIQATPEDYFPMTIQTVDSYTIDQEDYTLYATLDQYAPMMVTIMPIEMIIEGLCNSVVVQYGAEKKPFTFNMETLEAAIGGDSSPTSLAIQDFISKVYSAPESLLPVTYSNFEYSLAVKGGEYFVTSIGERAFDSCSALETVTFGENSRLESIGNYAFQNCSSLTSIEISSSVTSIGDRAFLGCHSLTSIEIPSSVTSIGSLAFDDCYALAEVYNYSPSITASQNNSSYLGYYAKIIYNSSDLSDLEDIKPATRIQTIENVQYYVYGEDFIALAPSVARGSLTTLTLDGRTTEINQYAFSSCSALKTVTFGENSQPESIGYRTFEGCTNLTSIKIPSSVTSIGEDAFRDCDALETVTFGANSQLGSIGDSTFRDCIALKTVTFGANSQLESIGNYAFYNCIALKTVTFGENSQLESIGDEAFYRCSITSIEIPSGVTSIERSAFSFCDDLKTVTFEENSQLENIGDDVFYACTNLTSIKIPSAVTSIGNGAFAACSNLTSIEIPSSVTSIGFNAFSGTLWLTNLQNTSYGIATASDGQTRFVIEVPTNIYGLDMTNVKVIAQQAFSGCSRLTSIEIPSSMISIGSFAFSNCSALKTVTFEENSQLENIENSAFSYCSNLTSIEIPSSVTSIGDSAFYDCSALATVTFEANSQLESIGSGAFSDTPWLTNLQNTSYGIATASDGQTRFVIDVPTDITDDELDMTNVKVIADYAFRDCSNLTSIEIPSSVTSIGSSAFSNCSALETVTFGANSQLGSIGGYAFSGCSNLTNIEIPSSVTSIGGWAFTGCDALATITFKDTESVWVLDDTSNTEITISKYTPQVLADYLTSYYSYYNYTWTKKQSA